MPALLALFILIGGMLTVGGCATNPVSGRPELTLVSAEQEKKIGEEEAKKVEAEQGLLNDPQLSPYLDALGQRLARESPRQNVDYRFHIVDMAEPNAFALPGGYIYVSRGLLALANSEDELAGVVGHEIAHVAGRHTVQRISKQGPVAVLFGVVSGITGLVSTTLADAIGGIGDVTQGLVFAPYGRSQETEADRVGQEMAAQAGWSPAALATFLTTLGREADLMSKQPRKPSFFDSHPATPDRVSRTTAHAKELTRATRPPLRDREKFLAQMDGLVVGQRAANGLVVGRTFVHPDLGFFIQLPEKWTFANTPRQMIAVAPDGQAAVLLRTRGTGSDPMDGARALEKATNTPVSANTQRTTINGLPAAHTQLEADGKIGLDLTWIAFGGVIYQVVGLAPKQRYRSLQPVFTSVAQSFRPLTASERADIKETRIRLVRARAGETIEALATRSGSAWTKEEIAVANGLQVGGRLEAEQLIKVAIVEPYQAAAR